MIVGVVSKPQEAAKKRTIEVISWLEQRGVSYRIDAEIAAFLGFDREKSDILLERERFTSECNIIVVLGGDGTMISVSRHPSKKPARIIGVNLGTLGFLTEVTLDELFATLEFALQGKEKKEARFLLQTDVVRNGKVAETFNAINDVVITKEALARIFGIKLAVNNEFAALIRGDGVIVSTPVGSTAYSLAAGGSIVHPMVKALLVTPICPHSLTTRPLVLPGDSKVELEIVSSSKEPKNEVFLTIDGQEGMALLDGDQLRVTTSESYVYFVKSPTRSYFEVLGTKLKWANH